MWKTTNKSTLPQQLRLTDPGVREQLEALPASQVLIGHGTDGQPVCVDLDNESPHVLVYSASGGGTSTALLPDEHAARALADVVLDESDRLLRRSAWKAPCAVSKAAPASSALSTSAWTASSAPPPSSSVPSDPAVPRRDTITACLAPDAADRPTAKE